MISTILDGSKQHEWYANIIYYLKNLTCLDHLVDYKRRALRLKASKYCIVQGDLGWRNSEGLVLRCVEDMGAHRLMKELHVGLCGGHYAAKTTTHKIVRVDCYCPTIFAEVRRFVRAC
jgi:hypothetical protein